MILTSLPCIVISALLPSTCGMWRKVPYWAVYHQTFTGTVLPHSATLKIPMCLFRSVSFMAKQQREPRDTAGSDTSYDKCFGPPPVWPSGQLPSAGGRRSVESTPQSARWAMFEFWATLPAFDSKVTPFFRALSITTHWVLSSNKTMSLPL